MDKAGADFFMSVRSVKERLNGNAVAIQIPIGAESNFTGIVDLVEMKAYIYDGKPEENPQVTDIPADLLETAKTKRQEMIEAIASYDDEFMMKVLDGQEVSQEEIKNAIRKGTLTATLFPCICGTSFKNKGVKKMIDAVVEYLPSPLDIPPTKAHLDDKDIEIPATDDHDFVALAFKVMTDPYVGSLTFFRTYAGVLKKGSYVYNSTKDVKERIGRIIQMHANSRQEIDECHAGDIDAAVGLKATTTGDTLVADKAPKIILEKMVFPEPVISQALEPETKDAMEKLSLGLQKLAAEDPTFRTYTDEETGQTIIAGMGELHLDIIVDRLKREHGVKAKVGAPQVSYRETITKTAEVEGKHIKQSGGKGQYGHV